MRLLSKIVLINWHLFDAEEIYVSGDMALLGENRSGKSTVLDALQVVLSGCNGRFFKLNRSAGEKGKRVERSVRDYCLGRFESFAKRPATRSYIGLVFTDDVGIDEPVSLGLALEARESEPKETIRSMFILDGYAISASDFISVQPDGKTATVVDWDEMKTQYRTLETAGVCTLHTTQVSKEFIREYMRILMTPGHSRDYERYVKTLVNGLAFEGMSDVSSFMRSFVLEERKINISQLRTSIRTYRDMRDQIDQLTEELKSMEALQAFVDQHDAALAEAERYRFLHARTHLLGAFFANRKAKRNVCTIKAELEQLKDHLYGVETQLNDLEKKKEIAELRLNEAGTSGTRIVLEVQREAHDKIRVDAMAALARTHRDLSLFLREIQSLTDELVGFPGFLANVTDLSTQTLGKEVDKWPENPGLIDQLLGEMRKSSAQPLSHLKNLLAEIIGDRQNLQREMTETERRLKLARSGSVSLGAHTDALREELNRHGIHSHVLCEMVEVVDETWRAAAEALLGRDREAIFVEPSRADDAIKILRDNRRKFGSARLANTRKMRDLPRDRVTAQTGSLATVLATSDEIVRAFIAFRIGSVRLAQTQDDLHRPGRAVMRDGTYDDGIVVTTRSADGTILGRAAQAFEKRRLEHQLQEQVRALDVLSKGIDPIESASEQLKRLSELIDNSGTLRAQVTAFDEAVGELEGIDAQLSELHIQQNPELQAALDRVKAEIKTQNKERDNAILRQGRAQEALKGAEGKLDEGSSSEGSNTFLQVSWQKYKLKKGAVPARDRSGITREFVQAETGRGVPLSPNWFLKRAEKALGIMQEHEAERATLRQKTERATTEHFLTFARANKFDPSRDEFLGELRQWLLETITKINEVSLPQYQEKASAAAEAADEMFKNSFLAELRKRFGELKDETQRLNKALMRRPLHNEVYSFSRSERPNFKPLIALVKAAEKDDSILLPLFGVSPERAPDGDEDPHQMAIQNVEDILLKDDFDFSEYEDYRNYYDFEMVMRDQDNGRETTYSQRRGTGSGAEQQVPFYVAIGAALSRVYHGIGQEKREGLGVGLAMFDEAFSKLDGKNQRQILQFYKEIGLQTIAAAPSERKTILMESVDTITEVYRFGDDAECSTLYIKDAFGVELMSINPDNTPVQDLRDQFNQETASPEHVE